MSWKNSGKKLLNQKKYSKKYNFVKTAKVR